MKVWERALKNMKQEYNSQLSYSFLSEKDIEEV